MTLDLSSVMDGLADLAIDGACAPNVYAYPIDKPAIPCIVIGYPSSIEFDRTYRRGGDTLEFPIYYLAGRSTNTDARDALSAALDGAAGVKEALDGPSDFGDVRVESAVVEEITVNGISYIGLKFTVGVLTNG